MHFHICHLFALTLPTAALFTLAVLLILPAQGLVIVLPKLFVGRPRPEGALSPLAIIALHRRLRFRTSENSPP